MKKIGLTLLLSLTTISAAYAGKDFDVESAIPGKPYAWTSVEKSDDVGIINSTTKARHVRIEVNANSPSAIYFDYPCENQDKVLVPGKSIVCLLKPYNRGSGVGYLISWGANTSQSHPKPAKGTLTVQFN